MFSHPDGSMFVVESEATQGHAHTPLASPAREPRFTPRLSERPRYNGKRMARRWNGGDGQMGTVDCEQRVRSKHAGRCQGHI